jgi:glycosyltransferase involved in cell wall biosynthesis
MATVSVIVPNYNHAKYLRKRVESILAQTYQDFELILLDDCSTDESREILREYAGDPRVRMEFNAENSGSTFKQWDKGLGMASGKYVWIAESDDHAEPQLLERLTKILDAHADVTFAYCRSWMVDENDARFGYGDWYCSRVENERWERDFLEDGRDECRWLYVLSNPVPNASAVVFRREAYQRVGGAGGALRLCGDFKMWASLALLGKVGYVGEPLNSFRAHTNNARSKWQQGALDIAEYFYVMRWVMDRVAPPESLKGRPRLDELFPRMPIEQSTEERVRSTKRTIDEVARWNLRYNDRIPKDRMRAYFVDWEFAIVGKEFAMEPPGRWRFFKHRVHFYRRYSAGMNWKQKLVNLGRVAGAPVVGYQRRHWPEQAYAWIASAINRASG